MSQWTSVVVQKCAQSGVPSVELKGGTKVCTKVWKYWTVEYKVWSVECPSVVSKCNLWSVQKWRVWSVECVLQKCGQV